MSNIFSNIIDSRRDIFFYTVRDWYWRIHVSYFPILKTLLQFLPHVLAKIARCFVLLVHEVRKKLNRSGHQKQMSSIWFTIYTTKSLDLWMMHLLCVQDMHLAINTSCHECCNTMNRKFGAIYRRLFLK